MVISPALMLQYTSRRLRSIRAGYYGEMAFASHPHNNLHFQYRMIWGGRCVLHVKLLPVGLALSAMLLCDADCVRAGL